VSDFEFCVVFLLGGLMGVLLGPQCKRLAKEFLEMMGDE
jgi:hypothetical protein